MINNKSKFLYGFIKLCRDSEMSRDEAIDAIFHVDSTIVKKYFPRPDYWSRYNSLVHEVYRNRE